MVLAFSLILSIALLAILVVLLRRSQTANAKSAIARDEALPPLKTAGSNLKSLYDLAQINDQQSSPAEREEPPANEQPSPPAPPESDWLERIMSARKEGNPERALLLAEAAYPRWGAYTQACLILRQMLREQSKGNALSESALHKLYQAAAMAEFLHEKGAARKPTQQELLTVYKELAALRFSYKGIGYDRLRLIRKADIKLFNRLWGLPEQHRLPRQAHQEKWSELLH